MAFTGFDLFGRVTIVAGGARGMGRAVAIAFAARGAQVLVADVVQPDELPQGVSFFRADVRVEADVAALMAQCRAQYGHLDVLVNAVCCHAPAGSMDCGAFSACLDTNVTGALRLMQHAAARMRPVGGSIINFVPMDGAQVSWLEADCAAAASGAAVTALTKTLAALWTKDGVRVNAIAVGPSVDSAQGCDAVRLEEQLRFTPQGRLAQPEDVVGAAVYLASAGASYTSGHVLVLDGGHNAY